MCVSEVDLIASLYDRAATLPGLEKVDPKGYKFTSKWNPRNIPNFKFKKFWKKYQGKLTFYFSGQIIPQTKPIPIFSIYHRRKLLPYFEALVDFQKGRVIIRYQGVTSFQRSFISYDSPIQSISGGIIQINTDKVNVQLDCLPPKSIRLNQKIAPIPRSSKIALQDVKSKEKVIVSKNIDLCTKPHVLVSFLGYPLLTLSMESLSGQLVFIRVFNLFMWNKEGRRAMYKIRTCDLNKALP